MLLELPQQNGKVQMYWFLNMVNFFYTHLGHMPTLARVHRELSPINIFQDLLSVSHGIMGYMDILRFLAFPLEAESNFRNL